MCCVTYAIKMSIIILSAWFWGLLILLALTYESDWSWYSSLDTFFHSRSFIVNEFLKDKFISLKQSSIRKMVSFMKRTLEKNPSQNMLAQEWDLPLNKTHLGQIVSMFLIFSFSNFWKEIIVLVLSQVTLWKQNNTCDFFF